MGEGANMLDFWGWLAVSVYLGCAVGFGYCATQIILIVERWIRKC